MEINPSLSSAPFASVDKISAYPAENEILFSMNTVFKIGTKKIDEGLWEVNLSLTKDNDQQFRYVSARIRIDIQNETGLRRLITLLERMV
jgi:hypothetical protein